MSNPQAPSNKNRQATQLGDADAGKEVPQDTNELRQADVAWDRRHQFWNRHDCMWILQVVSIDYI